MSVDPLARKGETAVTAIATSTVLDELCVDTIRTLPSAPARAPSDRIAGLLSGK